jgi:hypothetical protein
MRWLKHMSRTRKDEKIARLIGEHGHRMYGIYWSVVEVVAETLDPKTHPHPSVTYPISEWSHLLSLRGSLVMSSLSTLAVTRLVTVERSGSDVTVTIPNLLKYRDEYSQRSGQAPDTLPSKIQKQNTDTDKEKPPSPLPAAQPPAKKPKQNKTETDPALRAKIIDTAHKLHDQHPARRRIGIGEITSLLTSIMQRQPASDRMDVLDEIVEIHAKWCRTEDWSKDDGQYSPGLAKYLRPSLERYLEYPEPTYEEALQDAFNVWNIGKPNATLEDFLASGKAPPAPKPVQKANGQRKLFDIMEGV